MKFSTKADKAELTPREIKALKLENSGNSRQTERVIGGRVLTGWLRTSREEMQGE